jgi:integrase
VNGHKTRGLIGADRTKPCSVSQLVALWYRSPGLLDLSPCTQMVYRGIVDKSREKHGDKVGAVRVDAVKLGPENVRNGKIAYRRQNTQRSGGVLASVPIHPDLAEELDSLAKDLPSLATQKGTTRSAGGQGNLMQRWTEGAKLPRCSAHRLRKTCAHRLAEAGATAHEIGAVTEHKPLALVERDT